MKGKKTRLRLTIGAIDVANGTIIWNVKQMPKEIKPYVFFNVIFNINFFYPSAWFLLAI